jgi:signal transduction histidine kinase
MNPISAFFVRNIIPVFFFYGLAFFAMGLALALASRHKSEFKFVQAIRPLAAFGLLHGLHEWIEMFQKIAILTGGHSPTVVEEIVRLALLILSFLMLLAFGIWLLGSGNVGRWQQYGSISGMLGLWALGLVVVKSVLQPPPGELIALTDALARYSLGIPGALLGTWALMAQQRTFHEHDMPQFGRDLVWCATALFLYGVIGQIFVRQTVLVPSTVINSTLFLQWFGIPVQLFRGVLAALLAFYMVRALRAFELETRRRVEAANLENAGLYQEAQEREKLLGDLLKQVVGAQEAERQRIARELHDATGQSLTAIALGLRGIETILGDNRPQVVKQLREVKSFSTNALDELRRIIADLRPSQLDDLGLAAALQWYTRTFEQHHSIPTDFIIKGRPARLPAEYETVLFRITQEALTNIAKHAHASRASVTLETCTSQICVTIQDDGCGFDPKTILAGAGQQQTGWGLLGIRERALLLGGHYEIDSKSGFGTRVRASIPLEKEATDVENTAALG